MKIFTEQPLLQYFGPLATKIQELIYKNNDLKGQLNRFHGSIVQVDGFNLTKLAEPWKNFQDIKQNLEENLKMLQDILEEAFKAQETSEEVWSLKRDRNVFYDALQECYNEIDKIQLH